MTNHAANRSLTMLRIIVAGLMLIHGLHRALHSGHVAGFGDYLTAEGLPAGHLVATIITGWEILGGTWLAIGWKARIPALVFATELAIGMVMVHASEGWFVVGGGRNGVEYSVVLIAALLAVAWASPIRPDA